MEPVDFPERNIIFAENQPEYLSLPAFKNNSEEGEVITCWKLTFSERLRILFTGNIWVSFLTFNKPLTPSYLTTKKEEVIK